MNISEFELIQNIQEHLVAVQSNLIQGIGDDCAVVKKDDKNVFLITTDCLIENIHFDFKYCSFIDLGKKAMSVNLSDIAAMGGKPLYAFITLGVPPKINEGQIADLYTGLNQVAQEFSVAIAGGDTSRSPNDLFINITVVGEALREQYKLRSAAKVGDGIYVSDFIGSAAVGLALFNKGRKEQNNYIQALRNPGAKISLGQMLAERPSVHAMIDTSDGLIQDLTHILRVSKVSAKIEYKKIPREKDFEFMCKDLRIDPIETLLTGGEDYQLIFTMDDVDFESLDHQLKLKKNIRVTRIGEVTPLMGLPFPEVMIFDEKGKAVILKKTGFDHFN